MCRLARRLLCIDRRQPFAADTENPPRRRPGQDFVPPERPTATKSIPIELQDAARWVFGVESRHGGAKIHAKSPVWLHLDCLSGRIIRHVGEDWPNVLRSPNRQEAKHNRASNAQRDDPNSSVRASTLPLVRYKSGY